ncbi:MAG: hypothetical protein ACREP6_06915 [Candidatus Binataceae bacterium]
MLSRRDLLKGTGAGLILLAPPSLLHIPLKLMLDPANTATPELVADSVSAEAVAFIQGARASSRTARVIGVDGTDFINELTAAWAKNPRALAGLTQTSVALVIEAIARDYGLGVAYRGWHQYGASGEINHALYGHPAAVRRLGRDFAAAGNQWGRALGAHIGELTAFDESPASTRITVRTGRPHRPGALVSWAVAPVTSAARA